jgi:uncharacterized protein YybS (DUF2232 family)
LTEGAILAALVAMLALATRYLPVVGLVTLYLCPLPLALLVIRRGLRVAVLGAVVATLVGAMLAGPIVGFSILISFAPMGLTIGMGARRGWSASRIVLLGTLVSMVAMVASFLGLTGEGATTLEGMRQQIVETMERSIQSASGFYGRFGMSKAQIDAMTKQYHAFIEILPYLLPAMLLTASGVAAWLNYEVGRRVLRRLGYELAMLPPIRSWRLPTWTTWLFIAGFLISGVGGALRQPVLVQSGNGVFLSAYFAFMLQGVVVSWVILGNFELRSVERTIAMVLAISLSSAVPIINVVFLLIGVLDSTWKVRERWGVPRGEPLRVDR